MLQRIDVWGELQFNSFVGFVFVFDRIRWFFFKDRKNYVVFKSKSLGVRFVLKFWICLLSPG